MSRDEERAIQSDATFLGHPSGVFVLSAAEMWERFSYCGMQALLVLYLTKHLMLSDGNAYLLHGSYTSLAYVAPMVGGYLADRWLNRQEAVLYGAVLLTAGHLLLG